MKYEDNLCPQGILDYINHYCEECIPDGYVSEEIYDDTIKCDVCHENEAAYKAISTDTKEGKLADIIINIIGDMYGSQEMCNPSYDIIELSTKLVKKGVIVDETINNK